jgi:hypothetical protein
MQLFFSTLFFPAPAPWLGIMKSTCFQSWRKIWLDLHPRVLLPLFCLRSYSATRHVVQTAVLAIRQHLVLIGAVFLESSSGSQNLWTMRSAGKHNRRNTLSTGHGWNFKSSRMMPHGWLCPKTGYTVIYSQNHRKNTIKSQDVENAVKLPVFSFRNIRFPKTFLQN